MLQIGKRILKFLALNEDGEFGKNSFFSSVFKAREAYE